MRRTLYLTALLAAWLLGTRGAAAHPMGNFSINHYARLEAGARVLKLRYVLDRAEIPTEAERAGIDRDGDGQQTPQERDAYLKTQAVMLVSGLSLMINGQPALLQLQQQQLTLRPGAGGLPTMLITLDFAPTPSGGWPPAKTGKPLEIAYRDDNYPDRTGWKEIVTVAGPGMALLRTNAAKTDRSHELTVFPTDPGAVPPRQTEATFFVVFGAGTKAAPAVAPAPNTAPAAAHTPHNAFTQSIARDDLTPGLILAGLLAALAFGAIHALAPGHGKTLVAAYLVGARGTPRHAALLGLIVTVTHTFGVFTLGLLTLFASRYIVPERLYPILNAVSGLLILAVGLWLLQSRLRSLGSLPSWRSLRRGHRRRRHRHGHRHHGDDGHQHHMHSHDHAPPHEHPHSETAPAHGHEHLDHEHGHEHGHDHHHHVPEGPITLRTLLALGISGGIVPCPEALVVLLAAVRLHRIGYGMLLITAFSVGLAATLIAIGLLVVAARRRLESLDRLPASNAVLRFLPVASAVAITLIGLVLTVRAWAAP